MERPRFLVPTKFIFLEQAPRFGLFAYGGGCVVGYNLFEIAVEPTHTISHTTCYFSILLSISFINYQQLKVEYKRVFGSYVLLLPDTNLLAHFSFKYPFTDPHPASPPQPLCPVSPTHPPIPCIHVINIHNHFWRAAE
jgi:hypothetical protein